MNNPLTVYFDEPKMCEEFLAVLDKMEIKYDFISNNKYKSRSMNIVAVIIDISNIECENLLVVCGKNTKTLPEINAENICIILNSQSKLIINEKNTVDYKFITYGFSSRDTVTLSSVTADKAIVSIQRGFSAMNGRKIEPMELVVDINVSTNEEMLAIVTAMLFL